VIRPILAAACLIAFVVLGNTVSHRPPGPLDAAAHGFFYGHGVPVAIVFTQLGRFPAYAAMCALAIVFGLVRRAWFVRALTSVVVLAGAWKTSDLYKDHFERARPEHLLVFPEPSYSYASGHAVLALTFFGGWALYAWNADLPYRSRLPIAACAAALVSAIAWSRLALGAHYLTDVIGGLLLGATFVLVQAVVAGRWSPAPADPFAR
jgi:undecaprenyl-diphosphatase